MKEICAFQKTKSAISSLSLSSSEDNVYVSDGYFDESARGGGRGEEEKKSDCAFQTSFQVSQNERGSWQVVASADRTSPTAPSSSRDNSNLSNKTNPGTISKKIIQFKPYQVTTSLRTQSKSCEGKLIARILPKSYAEYDTRKPTPRVDATPFIRALSSWKANNEPLENYSGEANHHYQETIEEIPQDDEESVVILDLYILRSAYLDRLQQAQTLEPMNSEFHVNSHNQREDNVHSLMGLVDVARNHNFGPKGNVPKPKDDNHTRKSHRSSPFAPSSSHMDDPTPNQDNISNNNKNSIHNNNKNSIHNNNNGNNNVFHLHMNRPSNEEAARTLRRLELSTTRKLQSLNPYNGCGKHKKGKDENLATVHQLTSSKLVLQERGEREDDGGGFMEVELSELSSADMWRTTSMKTSSDGDTRNNPISGVHPMKVAQWGIALTIPNMIIPWSDDVNESDEESNNQHYVDDMATTQSSAYNMPSLSSATTTPSTLPSIYSSRRPSAETVYLDITSNPPTILSIDTFENFTTHVFTGVPLVVETKTIYATHAIVTWFVGDEIVKHDCNSYTPKKDDVGKPISVLITPIRPGHNGDGCQEAYTFYRSVELLPMMPIMDLRKDWSIAKRRSDVSLEEVVLNGNGSKTIQSDDRLRVLTYNVLADLYAARDIGQHLMYAHCDVEFLMRQRRMPMIMAEILSYDADIICLQEVDGAIHNDLLRPVLQSMGYQGFYSNKVSSQSEGCSMFWSTKSFETVSAADMRRFPLRSLLTQETHLDDDCGIGLYERRASSTQYFDAKANMHDLELERWESMDGIRQLLQEHEEVRKVYEEEVGQIVQMARLTPRDKIGKPEHIVVANTHLFYHPMADHIRVMQAYAICHELDRMRREGAYPDPVLICGDFNSGPLSGAVRLMLHRSVDPNENDCWRYLNEYKWECGDNEYMLDHGFIGNYDPIEQVADSSCMDEKFVDAHEDEESINGSYYSYDVNESMDEYSSVVPPAIALPYCFPELVSGCKEVPRFTNFAVDFVETLDYVFVSKASNREPYGFLPIGEAPMPSEDLVREHVAMPNKVMPSDHVSIICDFKWAKY